MLAESEPECLVGFSILDFLPNQCVFQTGGTGRMLHRFFLKKTYKMRLSNMLSLPCSNIPDINVPGKGGLRICLDVLQVPEF